MQVGLAAVVVAFSVLVADVGLWFPALVVAATIYNLWRASVVLHAGPHGLSFVHGFVNEGGTSRLRTAGVPWASIDAVTIGGGFGHPTLVSVRLKPGAPLPSGVRGIIRGPGGQADTPPELRTEIPGDRLDRAALTAVAQQAGVPVVDGTG